MTPDSPLSPRDKERLRRGLEADWELHNLVKEFFDEKEAEEMRRRTERLDRLAYLGAVLMFASGFVVGMACGAWL